MPMPDAAAGAKVTQLAVGEMGTASLHEDGSVWLWGMARYFVPTRLPIGEGQIAGAIESISVRARSFVVVVVVVVLIHHQHLPLRVIIVIIMTINDCSAGRLAHRPPHRLRRSLHLRQGHAALLAQGTW